MSRVLVVVAALLVAGVTAVSLGERPAAAALTNVWPADAAGDIYPQLSSTDALFAYVTSDFRGGRVCVIPESGVGSCGSPAWGSPNVIIGVGTVYTLLEGHGLKPGNWRLLTESPQPASDGWDRQALSDVFTVDDCSLTASCSSQVGQQAAQAFKVASGNVGNFSSDACASLQRVKDAKKVIGFAHAAGSFAAGAGPGALMVFSGGFALEMGGYELQSYNNVALEILLNLSCEVARMHEDIANDPPDANFATVAAPVFHHVTPSGQVANDALIDAFDREQAYGHAALTAYERYQGAVIAGDAVAQQRQLDAVAANTFALADSMRTTVEALDVAATSTEAAFVGTPFATADEITAWTSLSARMASSGFNASELAILHGAGLTNAEISSLATWLHFTPGNLRPGETMHEVLRALSTTTAAAVSDIENFALEVSNVRVPLPPNVRPTARFIRNPAQGPAPLAVTFDASGSSDPDGSIASYAWDFGDGGHATGVRPAHTFGVTGTYRVVLTVTDNRGGTATTDASVTAVTPPSNVAPVAAFSATPDTPDPLTVQFSSSSTDADGSIVAYLWNFGDGGTSTDPVTSHAFAAGTYSVTLTVTDDHGAVGVVSVDITVAADNVAPIANAVIVSGTPDPMTATFDASGSTDSDGYIASYRWDFGDGQSSPYASTSHFYRAPGMYPVSLTIADDKGATAVATGSVTVHSPPMAAAQQLTDAVPLRVSLDASRTTPGDGAIVRYDWDFGDGSNGVGQQVSHTYALDGPFSVTLTVTDVNGLTATASIVVYVRPNHPPVTNDFQLEASPAVAFDALQVSSDQDGNPIVLSAFEQPAHGTLSCDPSGGCLYTASDGFLGDDGFAYTASDAELSSTGHVVVHVSPLAAASVTATNDLIVTSAGVAGTVDVLANDTGVGLSVTSSAPGSHGSSACTTVGACTYTPDAGFVGDDAFVYTVTDGSDATATAFVHVEVAPETVNLPVLSGRPWPPSSPASEIPSGSRGRWTAGGQVSPSGAAAVPGLERDLAVGLTGAHVLVPASVVTAPGWAATPTSAGLTAHAGDAALLGESTEQDLTSPGTPISQGTGGDSHVPILVGSKVYSFFHVTAPTSVACVDRKTGRRCPGYPILLNVAPGDIPGPGAVFGSRIYVHVNPQAAADELYCWDTATARPCGLVVLERGGDGRGSAPVAIGANLFAMSLRGVLHCLVGATGAPCATPSVQTGLTSVFDIVSHGARVFASDGRSVVCVDTTTMRSCVGWDAPLQFRVGQNLVNRHSADGTVDGVCNVGVEASECVADAGGPITTWGGWPDSENYYNQQQEAETGTRTFYGRSLIQRGLGCWDWSTMAVCAGPRFSNGLVVTDVDGTALPSAYGAAFDGSCIVALGDEGLVFSVSPNGESPCNGVTAARGSAAPVDLRRQRCDNSVGGARWREVRVGGADLTSGAELTSLVISVRDAQSGAVVATREMVGSAGTLDLSSISAQDHPALSVDATVISIAGDPAWADGIPPRIELRWFSDPAAVCFLTQTTVDCAAPPQTLSVSNTIGTTVKSTSLALVRPPECTPANASPVASGLSVSTPRDVALPVPLVGSDADGDRLTFAVLVPPAHGTVSLGARTSTLASVTSPAPNSIALYTPDAGYVGADSFTYTVFDGWARSSPARVAVAVIGDESSTTTALPTTSSSPVPPTTSAPPTPSTAGSTTSTAATTGGVTTSSSVILSSSPPVIGGPGEVGPGPATTSSDMLLASLPRTGTDTISTIEIVLWLIALGVAMVLVSRRRRESARGSDTYHPL